MTDTFTVNKREGIYCLTPVASDFYATYDLRYLKLDQTTPQTTVGTFLFPIGRFATGIKDNAGTPLLSIDSGNRKLYASDGASVQLDYSVSGGLSMARAGTPIANSCFLGYEAGSSASGATNSIFMGYQAGKSATSARDSMFFGQYAGGSATNASYSNFYGYIAGYQATNASSSNFFGYTAGQAATNANLSNFYGNAAGYLSTNAANSNFFGDHAGYRAVFAKESIFIGSYAGNYDSVDNTSSGTSIAIGKYSGTGGYQNSVAIGHGVINSAALEMNFGNVMKLTGIYNSDTPSSTFMTGGQLNLGSNAFLTTGTLGAGQGTFSSLIANGGLTVNDATIDASGILRSDTDGSLAFTAGVTTGNITFNIGAGGALVTNATNLVTNLNADRVDSAHVSTSGAAIPLMNGANTWSGNQIFTDNTHLYFGTGSDVDINYSGTVMTFDNNDSTAVSSVGKLQFISDYIPATGAGATNVCNLFSATATMSAITTGTQTQTGNSFTFNYTGPAGSSAYANQNVVGTQFVNTLTGAQSTSNNTIYSLTGVLYDVNLTGDYNPAMAMGIKPVVIDIDVDLTTNASHFIEGMQTTLTYNTATAVNYLWAGSFTVEAQGGCTVNTDVAAIYAKINTTVSGATFSGDVACVRADIQGTASTWNTNLAAGKDMYGFACTAGNYTAPSWAMAAKYTAGFWTNLPNNAYNYSFCSEGADAWMRGDNIAIGFGTAYDAEISFTGTVFLIQSDLITATDILRLRAGTNGLSMYIGATEQIILTDGVLKPTTNNDINLGTDSLRFKNIYANQYCVGAYYGIDATVSYTDIDLGEMVLTFEKGILVAQATY